MDAQIPFPRPAVRVRLAAMSAMNLRRCLLVCCLATLAPALARADIPEAEVHFPPTIAQQAYALTAALRRRDLDGAATAIQNLVRLRHVHEIQDLSPVAAAFLDRFDDAVVGATPDAAIRLATQGIEIAPGHPGLRFNLARVHFSRGFENIGPAWGAFSAGLTLLAENPRAALVRLGNTSFYLLWAFLFVAIIGTAGLVVRNGRALVHDVGDLFPSEPSTAFSAPDIARSRRLRRLIGSGLNRALALAILVLLLVLPITLGAGLLATMVLWLVVASLHARRSELVAVIVLMLVTGSIPLLGTAIRVPGNAEQEAGGALWTLLREHGSDAATTTLADHPEASNSPWIPVALALHEVQAGPMDTARLAKADEFLKSAGQDPAGAVALLSGNVALLRSLALCAGGAPDPAALEQARSSYERVLDAHPESMAALRGLAIVQGVTKARDSMEKTLQRLVAATPDDDLDYVARMRTLTTSSEVCGAAESLAAELRPPAIPDWQVYLEGTDVLTLLPALPLMPLLKGFLPGAAMPLLAIAGIFAVALVLVVRGRLRLASICPRCNTVSCGRCNTRASGFDFCPTCLFEQVKPAFLDPLDVVALNRKRDTEGRTGRKIGPILAMVVPGTGQVFGGRPLRGIVFLAALGIALALVLAPVPPLVDLHAFQGQASGLPVAPPVILAVVYLASALDVWKHRRT